MKILCFPAFSKSRLILLENLCFSQQNCDFEGLGEQTDRHTHRRTHALTVWEVGGWVGGEEGRTIE